MGLSFPEDTGEIEKCKFILRTTLELLKLSIILLV